MVSLNVFDAFIAKKFEGSFRYEIRFLPLRNSKNFKFGTKYAVNMVLTSERA